MWLVCAPALLLPSCHRDAPSDRILQRKSPDQETSGTASGSAVRSTSNRGSSTETVDVSSTIASLTFGFEASGFAGWKITIKNDSDEMLSLVWDESSFVACDGSAWGRLISDDTRRIDLENAHPPSPIPPHSTVTAIAFPESQTQALEFGYDLRRYLDKGHIYLTIQTSTGSKVTASGSVAESVTSPSGWWCFSIGADSSSCERDLNSCEQLRKDFGNGRPSIGAACVTQDIAYCYIVRISGHRSSMCSRNATQCESRQHNNSDVEGRCEARL